MANSERQDQPASFTRREFLDIAKKTTAALILPKPDSTIRNIESAAKIGLALSRRKFAAPRFQESDLTQRFSFLKDLSMPPERYLPPKELRGIMINMPFAWDEDEASQVIAIRKAIDLGATSIRLFVDNRFVAKSGSFNTDVISKIRHFGSLTDEMGNGKMGLVVTLYDQNDNNISDDYKIRLIKDSNGRQDFKNRIGALIDPLRSISAIKGWEVGNEIEIIDDSPDDQKKKDLTNWYHEMIAEIRKYDPDRPILTGLRDPDFIEPIANIINTIHLYPSFTGNAIGDAPLIDSARQTALQNYTQSMIAPLIVEETGVPTHRQVLTTTGDSAQQPSFIDSPISDDTFLVNTLEQVLRAYTGVPQDRSFLDFLFPQKKMLYVWNIGLWKLGNWDDSFDVDPSTHPQLRRVTSYLSALLQNANSQQNPFASA